MIPHLLLGGRSGATVEEAAPEQDYWLSYSDLMAGLLMVFTLMLLATLYSYQSGIQGIREILLIRTDVVQRLEQEFQQGEARLVQVQPDGTVRFADQVLFDENSAVLSGSGKEQLSAFAARYVTILFANPDFEAFRQQLDAIVVEGHTNDNGTYAYNLRLSQERALAVMEVLLGQATGFESQLQRYVTANGRSFAALVCANGEVDNESSIAPDSRCATRGGVDKERSRRIEIRLELRDRALLEQLLRLLDEA
jgi:outer membrane protein OmpA-like peptidoglycan-associated protein